MSNILLKKEKLYTISQMALKLELIDKKKNLPSTHTLRFWETKFNNIKAKKINGRRYFSENQFERLKVIKYLLKDKKMTIEGAKKFINNGIKLDDNYNLSIKTEYIRDRVNLKTKKLLEKIIRLKK
jgi:DNA-binding transcriptional MerR regulator|tara:strand:- start:215 stop:592 length:378 start_codon:yes stop_codon:yes gene_type:complete